jgi:hypothetical protein
MGVPVTVIDNTTTLEQHLLSYLKLRWSTPGMQSMATKPGFVAWVHSRGDSLDHAMTGYLDGFGLLVDGHNDAAFNAFAAVNLPRESESVPDFVLRYAFDRLENHQLVDDNAFRQMVSGLTFVTSASVGAAWTAWCATVHPAAGLTFPQALAAFKNRLATVNRMLTGEAVRALAGAVGFSFDGWVVQQLTSVAGGSPRDLALPKIQENAACWSWALSACADTAVPPDVVLAWLHAPLPAGVDPSMPPAIAAIADPGPALAAKNDLIAVKALMHQLGMATLGATYDADWIHNPARVAQVAPLNRRVFTAILTLNNFIVAPGSQNGVAVEYRIADGVSWEHWWVEYGPTVVETFPRMKYSLNVTQLRQVARMAPAQAAGYGVIRIDVQDLHPRHHDTVGAGLAQYL